MLQPMLHSQFTAAQVLPLNSNKNLHIGDPIGELSKYFQMTKNCFIAAIDVEKKGSGYIAVFDPLVFDQVILDTHFH